LAAGGAGAFDAKTASRKMSSVPHEGCNSENPTWAKFKKNFATNFNDNIDNDHRYTQ